MIRVSNADSLENGHKAEITGCESWHIEAVEPVYVLKPVELGQFVAAS
jgi:hypothetical protein